MNKYQDALIPNPLASDRQYERFYCLDISGLEDMELTDELNYLRAHLWGLPPIHWARERVFLLEEEMKKRKGNPRHDFRIQYTKIAEGIKV